MNKEYLIEKWLKDELNDAEKEAFNKLDDAHLNQDIIESAQHFKASHFSKVENFNTFRTHYRSTKASVKKLNWFNPLLKIASIVVIGLGIYFTFFTSTLTQSKLSQVRKHLLSFQIIQK